MKRLRHLLLKPFISFGILNLYRMIRVYTSSKSSDYSFGLEQVNSPEIFNSDNYIEDLQAFPTMITAGLKTEALNALNGYLQFIAVAILLEILLLVIRVIWNNVRDKNSKHLPSPLEINKAIKCICKLIFVSTICYLFFYTFIFGVMNLSYSIYIQGSSMKAGISLQTSESAGKTINPHRHLAYDAIAIASSVVTGPSYLIYNDDNIRSVVLSNNGSAAFLVTEYNNKNISYLKILNISDPGTPVLLGSIGFNRPEFPVSDSETDDNDLSDANGYIPPILLSPDEQMLYMTGGQYVYFVNVSDLTSPINVNTYIPPHPSLICSFDLSPDQKTLALVVGPENVLIPDPDGTTNLTIISLEDLTSLNVTYSKQFINTNIDDTQVYFYDDESIIFGGLNSWKVYNISNLEEPTQIASLELPESASTRYKIFSPDFKTVCSCATLVDNRYEFGCDIFNITDLSAPTRLPKNISGSYNGLNPYIQITASSDGRYLFIIGNTYPQVFDISNPSSPARLTDIYIPWAGQLVISQNSQRAIIANGAQLYSVQLNFNVSASRIFDLQNNRIQTYMGITDGIALSPDGSTMYSSDGTNHLKVFNISDPTKLQPLPLFNVHQVPDQILISPDGKNLFVSSIYQKDHNSTGGNSTSPTSPVLMIYDIETTDLLSSFETNKAVVSMAISPDGNTIFAIAENHLIHWEHHDLKDTPADFLILNVTNLTQSCLLSNISYSEKHDSLAGVALSQDGNIAFITGPILKMYNVSDPSSPIFMANYLGKGASISVMTSYDDNTAYITSLKDSIAYSYLEVVDISSPAKPTLLSSLSIPTESDSGDDTDSDTGGNSMMGLIDMSPDGNTLFLSAGGLTVVDISNSNSPNVLGFYSTKEANLDAGVYPFSLELSPDFSTAYLAVQFDGIVLINLRPDYILQLPSAPVFLGGTYSSVLNLLAKNPYRNYDANVASYKITSLSLFNIQYEEGYLSPIYTYSALPNWIDFDTGNQMLTITPSSKFQVGAYSIYGELSKPVDNSKFIGIENITTIQQATQLMATLVSLGYLDDQGFLTSKFDPENPLKIGSESVPHAKKIHEILKDHFFQATAQISVISSLNITFGDISSPNPKISVNTQSLTPLNLNLTLIGTTDTFTQFVNTDYSLTPSFAKNQTTLSVVGSLLDINIILSELIVFLNNQQYCDGTITISDGMNPELIQNISNISAYFNINSKPAVNALYFQSQINQVSIVTGEQFIIQFDDSTFSDPDGERLTYDLAMQDSTLQVPDWMTLRGLDLIGTPPEQLTGRNIHLKIVASNEYQSIEAPFTMHIGISWGYALKLITSYGGGLITILGFILYADKIYNILCKKRYRYPKDFTVKVGEEITLRTIYPVAFIGQQVRESRFILEELDKKVCRKIRSSSESEIADYFTIANTYKIDKTKLLEHIKEVAAQVQSSEQAKKLKTYNSGVEASKELIELLIIKEMILRLIGLGKAKRTKNAFRKLKESLFALAELEKCSQDGVCEFSVVRSKLYEKLRTLKFSFYHPAEIKEDSKSELSDVRTQSADDNASVIDPEAQNTPHNIEASFLPERSENINVDLLVDVLEAYAFIYHNMDADLINIDIVATEKRQNISFPRTIKRFIKKDLQIISYIVKGKQVGYGIEYETRKGFLKFSGVADYYIKEKTLVVQIKNIGGRILREIWINGTDDVQCEEDFLQAEAENSLIEK